MASTRTSLRFVVGTALLTATSGATAGGCSKPIVNTPAPEERPNINNTPPDGAGAPPPSATTGEPESEPLEPPIVNTPAPPPSQPPAEPPIVNTRPDREAPTVNTRVADPKPKPADDKPKKLVNTVPQLEPR